MQGVPRGANGGRADTAANDEVAAKRPTQLLAPHSVSNLSSCIDQCTSDCLAAIVV